MNKRIIAGTLLAGSIAAACIQCSPDKTSSAGLTDSITGTPHREAQVQLTLASRGILEISVDSLAMNYSLYPLYHENDTTELYIDGNDFVNGIDFYDLNKKKRIHQTLFIKNEKTGVQSAKKLYVQSLDSIYIYSEEDHQIVLTNYSGKIIHRYTFTPPDSRSWMANLFEPFTIRNGYAYVANMVFGDNRGQVGHKTLVRYNLETGTHEEYGQAYPEEFRNYLYYNFTPDFTFGHNNNIVVRFGSLPYLYNYNMDADSTQVISMASKFQRSAIVPNKTAAEFEELDDDFEELVQGQYLGVFYDKYAHVYYSMYRQGIPVTDEGEIKTSSMKNRYPS